RATIPRPTPGGGGLTNAAGGLPGGAPPQMAEPLWHEVPNDERQVDTITNGVHVPSWVSGELARLFERHLSSAWRDQYEDPAFWSRILEIPDEDLWAARASLREALFQFIRERARQRWTDESSAPSRVIPLGAMLDPHALTIGSR